MNSLVKLHIDVRSLRKAAHRKSAAKEEEKKTEGELNNKWKLKGETVPGRAWHERKGYHREGACE